MHSADLSSLLMSKMETPEREAFARLVSATKIDPEELAMRVICVTSLENSIGRVNAKKVKRSVNRFRNLAATIEAVRKDVTGPASKFAELLISAYKLERPQITDHVSALSDALTSLPDLLRSYADDLEHWATISSALPKNYGPRVVQTLKLLYRIHKVTERHYYNEVADIVLGYWPANAFSSAIAVLVLAYVVGHIMQSFASNVFPSKAKDTKGTRRYPSDFFLDPEDRTFSEAFKKELEREIFSTFKLKVEVGQYGGSAEEVDKQRRNAFFLCRALLIREETVSYGEQFEGLYALMRGLATSFWFGSAYFAGWATSALRDDYWKRLNVTAIFVALTVAVISTGFLVFTDSRFKHRAAVDAITFDPSSYYCFASV